MKKQLAPLLVVALLGLGAYFTSVGERGLLAEGATVPASRFEPLSAPSFESGSLRGQVWLVSFFATWCEPCREELPMLVRVAKDFEAKNVRLVAANLDEPEEQGAAVAAFVNAMPEVRPYVALATGEVGSAWNVAVFPSTFVVDAKGRVVSAFAGVASEAQVRGWLERALTAR